MNTEIPHLKIEQLTNGCIRLENESVGDSYVVDIHPVHLRYMAEVSGLIRERSTSEEAMEAGLRHQIAVLERDAERMQRSLMCIHTRAEQLFADLCLQHDNGHEDLTLEVAKCAALTDFLELAVKDFAHEWEDGERPVYGKPPRSLQNDPENGGVQEPQKRGASDVANPTGNPAKTQRVSVPAQTSLLGDAA